MNRYKCTITSLSLSLDPYHFLSSVRCLFPQGPRVTQSSLIAETLIFSPPVLHAKMTSEETCWEKKMEIKEKNKRATMSRCTVPPNGKMNTSLIRYFHLDS